MSDRLFVTLWLRGGFRKDHVCIIDHHYNDRPAQVTHAGKLFQFLGCAKPCDFWWNEEDGSPEFVEGDEIPVYFEVSE